MPPVMKQLLSRIAPYLQVAPVTLALLIFFGIPLALVVAVSFFEYDEFSISPALVLTNYIELWSQTTLNLYVQTITYALVVWAITLAIGFTVAYFLVFHVRSLIWQMALFLLCTVPFWTSNIIRMISGIPILGRNGVINQSLVGLGITDQPLEILLFSDIAVVIAYVHLFTLFMIVPIFNSMARIDPALLEAAYDGGASRWGVVWNVVLPLSKTGIALGAVFVVTQVMGDFFVVAVMSGGLSGSATSGIFNDLQFLNYPRAAASAVILLIIVLLVATAIFRLV